MPNPENLHRYKFQPGKSGNPKGRPKNRVPEQLAKLLGSVARARKFYSLSRIEVDDWEAAILSLPVNDLKALVKSEETSAYPKGLAVAVLTDMKNGRTTTLDKLRERQHGKAPLCIDHTTNGKDMITDPVTIEVVYTDSGNRENLVNAKDSDH